MLTGRWTLSSMCAVTATAGEIPGVAPPADDGAFEAPAVLQIIWADPQHMAEHIAIWSLSRFGPRARAAWTVAAPPGREEMGSGGGIADGPGGFLTRGRSSPR